VSTYCELLYSLEQDDAEITERVNALIRDVLNQALLQFERSKELEKLFVLLQYIPATPLQENDQLRRMRNRAYVYEMRRVRRHRRFLYGYLVVQAILIVLVFPLLFINTENGYIQDQIQHATNVPFPQEQRRTISYLDGLYWSLITAGSIGYGDIIPHTGVGRTLAAILGILGVTTVGVIAGLILEWITPRHLD